jgi:mono/diheme cytochrome c family protein
MNKNIYSFLLLALVASLLLACGGSEQPKSPAAGSLPTPPAPYTGKTNPLGSDAAAVDAGQKLYAANCASCHGEKGLGDGPAAKSLNPQPKPLTGRAAELSEDYLLWRISEGGMFAPFHSVMPSWKNILKEEQIWQVVAYLLTLQ